MSSVINIKNLNFNYEKVKILNDINLQIKENDFIIFTGPNGGGKTTLCNILTGKNKKFIGQIEIKDSIKISHAPQKITPTKSMPISVFDFLEYSGGISDIFEDFSKSMKIEDLFEIKITDLSGGQMQKVNLCNAIRKSSDVIILDEPDQNLDFDSQISFYTSLSKIHHQKTFIIVSHDIHEFGNRFKNAKFFCINQSLHCGTSFNDVHKKHCHSC